MFTTEGHILLLGQEHLKPMSSAVRKLRRNESHQCPAYQPVSIGKEGLPGLTLGIYSRSDVDYTSYLIGMPPSDQDKDSWHPNGWCEVPQVDLFVSLHRAMLKLSAPSNCPPSTQSYDFILSADGKLTVEDPSPGKEKIASVSDGFIVHNISGLRTRIVSRLDGRGYDVSKRERFLLALKSCRVLSASFAVGLHTIHSGQIVYINDTALALKPVAKSNKPDTGESHYPDVRLRFFVDFVDPMFLVQPGMNEVATSVDVTGHTAMFGANPSKPPSLNSKPLKFGHGEGTNLVHDSNNPLGCLPYERAYNDEAILVHRGKCTFLEKLKMAHAAGALGVVVLTDNEIGINPSADEKDLEAVGSSLDDMVMVVLRKSDGRKVSIMMDLVDGQGLGRVVVSVESGGHTARPPEWNDAHEEHQAKGAPPDRVLYLNGHPLLNTRLLV